MAAANLRARAGGTSANAGSTAGIRRIGRRAGRVSICKVRFWCNWRRARRARAAERGRGGGARAGIAATISVDSLAGPEPPRWPVQYAVPMTIRDARRRRPAAGAGTAATLRLALRFNPADAELLFEGSGHTYQELKDLSDSQKPLPWFASGRHVESAYEGGERGPAIGQHYRRLAGSDPEFRRNTWWSRRTSTAMASASRGATTRFTTARSTMRPTWPR